MNWTYLAELPPEEYLRLARGFFDRTAGAPPADAYFREIMLLSLPKVKSIEELPAYTGYFFTEDYAVDPKAREKILAKATRRRGCAN